MSTVKSPVKKRSAKKGPQQVPTISKDENEVKLSKYDFKPEKKMVLKSGTVRVGYLSRSPMGYHVFIEVSRDEQDEYDPRDVYEETTSFTIPYSTRKGVFEEIGEGIIITEKGICRLGRQHSSTEMEEVCYSSETKSIQEGIYPIIRIGEIVTNVGLVHIETSKKISRLRRWTYDAVNTSIQNFQRDQNRNRVLFDTFLVEEVDIATKLSRVIKELQTYMEANYTKENDEFTRQVRRNLEYANDRSIHFLEMCSSIQKMTERMNEMNIELENINRAFRNDFRDVNVFKEV